MVQSTSIQEIKSKINSCAEEYMRFLPKHENYTKSNLSFPEDVKTIVKKYNKEIRALFLETQQAGLVFTPYDLYDQDGIIVDRQSREDNYIKAIESKNREIEEKNQTQQEKIPLLMYTQDERTYISSLRVSLYALLTGEFAHLKKTKVIPVIKAKPIVPKPIYSRRKKKTTPPVKVIPTEVIPAKVIPAEVIPAEVIPAKVIPAEVTPAEVTPAEVTPVEVPAEVIPAEVIPAEVIAAEVIAEVPAEDPAEDPAEVISQSTQLETLPDDLRSQLHEINLANPDWSKVIISDDIHNVRKTYTALRKQYEQYFPYISPESIPENISKHCIFIPLACKKHEKVHSGVFRQFEGTNFPLYNRLAEIDTFLKEYFPIQ